MAFARTAQLIAILLSRLDGVPRDHDDARMCGISGIAGAGARGVAETMVRSLSHRGPDGTGMFIDPQGNAFLGHNRLSIIDLSDAGSQPMQSQDGRMAIVFNGEIYNYKELKQELSGYPFRTQTDTEVILAAFEKWGEACLDHFIGMFAFLLWDTKEQCLFAARDRFGVKPLYYGEHRGSVYLGSEIKALHAAGVPRVPDERTWALYLATGVYDHGAATFWKGIMALPAGHLLTWKHGKTSVKRWYDLADRVDCGAFDGRTEEEVGREYIGLLEDSVRLRFRSDVPVGISLSGGLDSSLLLGVVDRVHASQKDVEAYTFVTGDPAYDETSWVEQMVRGTQHPWFTCPLRADDVPVLAADVQEHCDEPFGGIPTLAYAQVFSTARSHGTVVVLDGQGMDEQWAGYDYYRKALAGEATPTVQGTSQSPVRPSCLTEALQSLSTPPIYDRPFVDNLRNAQYRDLRYTKIPRALRFSDRISMRSSVELREPFLDHRLVELAFAQSPDRKIRNGTGKWMLRSIAQSIIPPGISEAPKRPLQTPQREWLRGPLQSWATEQIEAALKYQPGDWLLADVVRNEWKEYLQGGSDNSFYVWQWISVGLMFGI